MKSLIVSNRQMGGVTVIPNSFIDRFLPAANGEFIKVYLMLLRLAAGDLALSVSQMADSLDNTEKDVVRALKYWEKQKLITLSEDENGEICGITLLDADRTGELSSAGLYAKQPVKETEKGAAKESAKETAKEAAKEAAKESAKQPLAETAGEIAKAAARKAVKETAKETVKETVKEPVKKTEKSTAETNPVDLCALNEDEEFSQLLFLAGRYTGKNLTGRDLDVLVNLYQTLGMSAELLEYVIEYCVENGHKSMRYIESVAINWHERGITTEKQAREEAVNGSKNTYAVLKAFGLNGRNPAKAERTMMDKWFRTYGLPLEVVLEACDRTIRAIHTPSFEYADKILTGWYEKGIRTKEDAQKAERERALETKGNLTTNSTGNTTEKTSEKTTGRVPSKNRFHNYTEREYDADALMKQILGMGGQ